MNPPRRRPELTLRPARKRRIEQGHGRRDAVVDQRAGQGQEKHWIAPKPSRKPNQRILSAPGLVVALAAC